MTGVLPSTPTRRGESSRRSAPPETSLLQHGVNKQAEHRPDGTAQPLFPIVIFSSIPPAKLDHFLRRLALDLSEVQVAGVLYETQKPPMRPLARIKRFLRLVPDHEFRVYAIHKLVSQSLDKGRTLLDRLLHWVHCCPENPNGTPLSLTDLAQECRSRGISFHITSDLHSEQSLEFTRSCRPALGVIYGTRILKPELFEIPRHGSINIHKHKVPEYRGTGVPGIWEMQDGKTEASVTVHRVLKQVDAGAVLGERNFSIDPLDTLVSVGLKADVLAIDLLIDVVRAESEGCSVEVPQPSAGKVYKGFKPHQIYAIKRNIRAKRRAYKTPRDRPLYKLFLRTLVLPVFFFRNRQRRRRKDFPVIILFHHLITDKTKFLGLPTEAFAKQVRFLKNHYRLASLPDALKMLHEGEVTMPTVVLTFDDGYAENFLCLRAVAEAENIPVSLFVCTQAVSEGAEFRHDLERKEKGFQALSVGTGAILRSAQCHDRQPYAQSLRLRIHRSRCAHT